MARAPGQAETMSVSPTLPKKMAPPETLLFWSGWEGGEEGVPGDLPSEGEISRLGEGGEEGPLPEPSSGHSPWPEVLKGLPLPGGPLVAC